MNLISNEANSLSITVYKAVPEEIDDYFFCKEKGEWGGIGDEYHSCGRQCSLYSPRNGKSGCCRHFSKISYYAGEETIIKFKKIMNTDLYYRPNKFKINSVPHKQNRLRMNTVKELSTTKNRFTPLEKANKESLSLFSAEFIFFILFMIFAVFLFWDCYLKNIL